jgi:hypothetical protein
MAMLTIAAMEADLLTTDEPKPERRLSWRCFCLNHHGPRSSARVEIGVNGRMG